MKQRFHGDSITLKSPNSLTRCWWPVSAAGEWTPPSGPCWAGTHRVSAAAGGAAPAWSPCHRAETARWAAHLKWPGRHPPAGSGRSAQTRSPAGGAAELLGWREKRGRDKRINYCFQTEAQLNHFDNVSSQTYDALAGKVAPWKS